VKAYSPSGATLPRFDRSRLSIVCTYRLVRGLPDTEIGTFTQAFYEEAKEDRRTVISMKND
jgi:hypothetical protein